MTIKPPLPYDTATQYHGLRAPERVPLIVLYQPQMAENIGMVARAMANCGLSRLALVQPRDGWPNKDAWPTASGAEAILNNAGLFDRLTDAVADCTLVFGSCAFERELIKPVLTAETAAQAIRTAHASHQQTAIVFGPERTGLTKDDLALCDGVITIPLNPEFASLNLAQAVLLTGYAWWHAAVIAPQKTQTAAVLDVLVLQEAESATQNDMDNLFENLLWALEQKNYFTNLQNKPAMLRNARSFLQRMRLTKQEARTGHGMLKALLDGRMWVKDKS
jgi:tRNA/rRNA methyltransferase